MAVWPDYALVEAADYTLAADSNVRRTTFEDGAIRQERQFSGAAVIRRIRARLLTDADQRAFRAWALDHAHSWFDFPAPDDDLAASPAPRRVRVRGGLGGIEVVADTSGITRTWRAELELEEAP